MSNAPSLFPGAGTASANNSYPLAYTPDDATHIDGKTEYAASMTATASGTFYETAFWEIVCGKQDGKGDGTVPASSGAAPRANAGGNLRQQFRLTGFSHEPACKDPIAQTVTHYAITKLASLARIT